MTTVTGVQTPAWPVEADDPRAEMLADGLDLPELADTMEEADARAGADRYLYALRSVKREAAANAGEHKTLMEYYATRHAERQGALERRAEYLRGVLKGLFGFMHTGKKKSLNLLGGRVGMRAQADELVVEGDAAVIVWARDRGFPSLVKTKPTLDRQALRVYMAAPRTISGTPPGVKLNERPDVFFATPAE